MNVQHTGFSYLSVQRSKFWLKQTLPEKVVKTTKNKALCSSVIYRGYFVLSSKMKVQPRISNINQSFHGNIAVL